jgi:hypothetical protein
MLDKNWGISAKVASEFDHKTSKNTQFKLKTRNRNTVK